MRTLIVGSHLLSTSVYAQSIGLDQSFLYTGVENYPICHTSVADCADLEKHLVEFDVIHWAQCSAAEFNTWREWFDVIYMLKKHHFKHHNVANIAELDPYNIRPYKDLPTPTVNDAVFIGCSHTHGLGLDRPGDNYAVAVSQYFDCNVVNLGVPGLGNYHTFQRFQRIKWNHNQLVVLQLTDIARLQFFPSSGENTKLTQSQLYNLDRSYINVFNDKQLMYMLLEQVDSAVKLARSQRLRLVMFYLGGNPDYQPDTEYNQLFKLIEFYLCDYPEFIPDVLLQNVDRGNDGMHFGPQSHAVWAQRVIEKIQDIYQ